MTAFVAPVQPPRLCVPHGATQYTVALAKTLHEESTQKFQMYQHVQRALVQKILEEIETKYLNSIRNRVTGQAPAEICALIIHVFQIYGKTNPQQLRENLDAVEQWNII